ncbi:IclR family transcriptional regulator [Nocardia terpenica]|uniref:Helix-turn-helix domain-containing protein n=1 Tax=Nocardia terpenica TaxID=455432 RepID=A0A6G9YZL9_9NOCA|nr:helix-turn-helix domain-containing protein [Nocardia terpenica]QIS18775.1 helix-turn-helix domain-containing protein [Nocardia terpenica]
MSDATRERTIGGRGVLEGAFALLEALVYEQEAGLTELSMSSGLPKATAYRLLGQLIEEGAVQRRAGRYRLGPRMFRLGQTWQPAQLLRTAVAHPMRQLVAATDRGAFTLSLTDRGDTMLIASVNREIEEAYPFRPGTLLPPGTAAEQILTAAHPNPIPPEGFSSPEWRRLTATARDRGMAYDLDTHRYGVACVAAPVRGPSGEVVAALAATVFEPDRIPALAHAVQQAAGLVTTHLARLLRSSRAGL